MSDAPSFPYKTVPFRWQRECLNLSAARRRFAILAVPGTGKTKTVLDNAAWLYLAGKIDTLLILAPNGVHKGWLADQVQEHLTDAVEDVELYVWESGASTATRWKRTREAQLMAANEETFLIVSVNTEAITAKAHRFIMSLFRRRKKVMAVMDESNDIAHAGAARTRRAWMYGERAAYTRILTGTLGDDAVMALYAQFRFLGWQVLGFRRAKDFKERYAEWEEVEARGRQFSVIKKDSAGRPMYKNLDELRSKIALNSFRVTEETAGIDLPPISYTKWYFDLAPIQRQLYRELSREYVTTLSSGEEMTADLRIVRDTRLQQIANGYETADGEPTRCIDITAMPRLDALMSIIDHYPGKMIIWVRWQLDADLIMDRIAHLGAVRYDGAVSPREREQVKKWYITDPMCRFFVANPAAAGRGLDGLQITPTVLFYSNYFRYVIRRQAEKRAHRAGAKLPVTVIDLVANKTIDETRIIPRLRAKQDVHDFMTGDPEREWI